MENTHIIKPFNEAINHRLRDLYLQSLGQIVKYPDQEPRQRVRKLDQWQALQPFGRHGWGATKGVYANYKNPIDIMYPTTKVWVWSDLHFGHKNIIRFSDRPFPDVETMNEMLVLEFNELVKPNDISIWVGDIGFYPDDKTNSILHRCNGYKILVAGNHDFNKRKLRKLHFDETHIVYNLTIDGRVVAFSHYPMDNLPNGWFNVHGHVHKSKGDPASTNRHVNVNCEFIDYKPISLQALADVINLKAEQPDDSEEKKIAYDEYD